MHISNTSREIAIIPNLHIGGHEKKLPIFKRLKNIIKVKTLEKELLGKKKFQKQENKIVDPVDSREFSNSTYILGAIYCSNFCASYPYKKGVFLFCFFCNFCHQMNSLKILKALCVWFLNSSCQFLILGWL